MIFGYSYEQFRISYGSYDGHAYTVGTPVNTYLTGAYRNAEQSYKANIFYLKTTYRF